MKVVSSKEIEESLLEQLEAKGTNTPYNLGMVKDYLDYYSLCKKLKTDINKNGVRLQVINGNGKQTEKINESITQLHKTTQVMLKLLQDLGLQSQIKSNGTDGYL